MAAAAAVNQNQTKEEIMAEQGTERLRVAVVGLRMGQGHLEALKGHPRAQIVAVCDPITERADEMAASYGARAYADYATMLDAEGLDGVCIATPNRLHAPMVSEALRRGLHVMCEKPLTLDTAEARALLEQARAAGLTHSTNFSNRPNPAVRYVKEQIENGMLGRVYEIHLTYLQDWLSDASAPYTWRNSAAEGGSGALGDIASHMLDLSRLFIGEVASVSADTAVVTPERTRPDGTIGVVDADDLSYLHLRYANGTHGVTRVSRVARGRCDLKRVELYGERASLVLEMDRGVNRVLRADEATQWRGDGFYIVYASDPQQRSWGGNVQAWVDASLARREMTPSFEDGLRCQEILDAALRSAAERRWVDL
jgi:predicted dehydrogenase